jgi:UDP-N-acetylglucosamine--N-acetylmuramyl-(pentapeptide) pyrophosphoryl-undecaprenol N-acetylglucosamine transferase
VYPALSVLQAVGNQAEAILWVGSENGMEADLIAQHDIPFKQIPAAGIHGVDAKTLPGNLTKLGKGFFAARKILREFKPDVLLFTGGYVAVPMALAGQRTNSLLYVPDIEPGLALKALSRYSNLIALTAEESRKYFKTSKPMVVTGYPTRQDFLIQEKSKARLSLGLLPDIPVILIIGGSKGAHLINEAVFPNLATLVEEFQIVHITGQTDWQDSQHIGSTLKPGLSDRYKAFPYLHSEISTAFSAADLAVSRAGASILGELPIAGLPAILVPYPFAWRYQKVNADYLAQKGAALTIENSQLEKELVPTIKKLMSNLTALSKMRAAMQALATPNAASKLAELLIGLSERKPSQGGSK